MRKGLAVISAAFLGTSAYAIVPNNQFSSNDSVVRISGTGGRGTGSIIHREFNAQTNMMFICVLTADHVTDANGNMSVGWGDIGGGSSFDLGLGSGLSSYAVFNKNNFSNADVSLLNLNIDFNTINAAQQATLNGLTPFNLAVAPAATGYTVRNRGFGRTGIEIQGVLNETVGYRTRFGNANDAYGTLRFMDQRVDVYAPFAGGGYNFDSMFYDLDRSDMTGYVANEGFGLSGDSGSGFFSGNDLVGIFTNAEGTLIRDNTGALVAEDYYYGFRGWGPRITDTLFEQIHEHCDPVPEPASMIAIGLGVVGLVARRKRSIKVA